MADLREGLSLPRAHKRNSSPEHLHYDDRSSDMLLLQGLAVHYHMDADPEGAVFAKCLNI